MAWWKFWASERRSYHVYNGNGSGWDVFGSAPVSAGVSVTEQNASELTAVGAAIRILSESIASLPLPVYKRTKDGGRERAPDHPLYTILHDAPNPLMTAMTFRELMMSHVLTWGNAYAEIEWDEAGKVRALWPLEPDKTEPKFDRVKRELVYVTQIGADKVTLPAYRVFHLSGLGTDGIKGKSPIQQHREAIGLAKATEKYGATYFGNGARPSGVLETDQVLKDQDAVTRLRTNWSEVYGGAANAHKVAVLEGGLKYKPISLPPEDSQFLQTRKFQLSEIARIFRIPPHLLGDLEKATFSNIEQQSLEFVVHTLRSWLVRWEQAISSRLLTPSERKKYFAEHNVDGLLRGDIKSRYEAYQIARQNGWMSANVIAKLENLPLIPKEEGGDAYLVNSAMMPISTLLKGGEGNEQGAPNTNGTDGVAEG
ncbi:phage portal protein [Paenibacillus sp. HJGM_3]|uniref:phage portal protein n=1 Tax=Paenibacillus sp. HJGM_3 TaxID=3379816 RepID=UPI00385DE6CF